MQCVVYHYKTRLMTVWFIIIIIIIVVVIIIIIITISL
jgi:hypothetical protein